MKAEEIRMRRDSSSLFLYVTSTGTESEGTANKPLPFSEMGTEKLQAWALLEIAAQLDELRNMLRTTNLLQGLTP